MEQLRRPPKVSNPLRHIKRAGPSFPARAKKGPPHRGGQSTGALETGPKPDACDRGMRFFQQEIDMDTIQMLALAEREQHSNDAARLVWAMNHMGLGSTHSEFSAHVLSVGGVGDLADCRVFVDAQMQK